MCHPDGPSGSTSPGVETSEVRVSLGDEAMPAFLATAPGAGRRPAVMVVGDIFGARTPFYEHLATLLAAEGFDALVPEFFFREGPLPEKTPEAAYARLGKLDQRRALDDLDRTAGWLRDRPTFGGKRVGTLGFCLGGTFVLDLAARREDLATVCYYGFPAGPPGPAGDAPGSAPKPLDEVDRITGPLLGFWGSEDERVGIANVTAFAQELAERDVDFRHTIVPGLDHGFMAAHFEPGADGHDAARSSWDGSLQFLRQHT